MKTLHNWTIPPVLGVSPDSLCDEWRWVATFPRMMGNTKSYRQIHNPQERAEEGRRCMVDDVDIITSRIVSVQCIDGLTVIDTEGNQYQLKGEPRPSFNKHCKLMGIDGNASDAVQQLVEKLR
jgi:hypothetical protein